MPCAKGFTLVELLITLLLASIVLAGAMRLYVMIQSHYVYAMASVRRQHDIALALRILQTAIRHAGFMGCRSLVPKQAVRVYASDVPVVLQGKVKPGTDTVHIHHLASPLFFLTQSTRHGRVLQTSKVPTFNMKKTLLINDCEHAEFFSVDSVYGKNNQYQLYLKKPLRFSYQKGTTIGVVQEEAFFVTPDHRLMMRDGVGNVDEIMRGVTAMTVRGDRIIQLSLRAVSSHPQVKEKEWNTVVARRN